MNNRPELERCAVIAAIVYTFAACVAGIIVWILLLAIM
jgi:hypothetical protein